MNIKFSFILLSLFLSFYFSTITTSTCRAGDYRLGQLNLPDNNNWFWNATAPNGDVFYWNICGQVSSTYCAFAQGTSVCQQSSNRQYSLGFETSELIFENSGKNGAEVEYSGGDVCSDVSGQPSRSAVINIVCTDDLVPVTSYISETDCSYNFMMQSVYGCEQNGANSIALSLFVLIAIFAFAF